jgi:hypothetical protein
MMASGREKREKAGEKLKDIIESLKGPKATKTDIETSNDSVIYFLTFVSPFCGQ